MLMTEYLQQELAMIQTAQQAKQQQLEELTRSYITDIESLRAQYNRLQTYRDSLTGMNGQLSTGATCECIFQALGWEVFRDQPDDLSRGYLMRDAETPIIFHMVIGAGREEIAELTTEHMRYWSKNYVDAKQILLLDAVEPNWGDIKAMATNKGICLMTTGQLLACYVATELHNYPAPQLRSHLEGTIGPLYGYQLIASEQGATI